MQNSPHCRPCMIPSVETHRREDVLQVDQRGARRREQIVYGPSTVTEDRNAQDFFEAACLLLVWDRLASQRQGLNGRESDSQSCGESGLISGLDDPFRHLHVVSASERDKSSNRQVDQCCLCRNTRLKWRRNGLDESEEDTPAATARDTRRLNVDDSEEPPWKRQ